MGLKATKFQRERRISIYQLTPAEKKRVSTIREIIEDGADLLTTSVYTSNGKCYLSIRDLRNYHLLHTMKFFAILEHSS